MIPVPGAASAGSSLTGAPLLASVMPKLKQQHQCREAGPQGLRVAAGYEAEPQALAGLCSPAVTYLSSTGAALSMHNSVFGDLKSEETELLYSAYGDETGVQCALR